MVYFRILVASMTALQSHFLSKLKDVTTSAVMLLNVDFLKLNVYIDITCIYHLQL